MSREFLPKIKRIDIFGESVTFTANGAYKYRTVCGGFTSIVFFIILTSYAIYLVLDNFQNSKENIAVFNISNEVRSS